MILFTENIFTIVEYSLFKRTWTCLPSEFPSTLSVIWSKKFNVLLRAVLRANLVPWGIRIIWRTQGRCPEMIQEKMYQMDKFQCNQCQFINKKLYCSVADTDHTAAYFCCAFQRESLINLFLINHLVKLLFECLICMHI